MTNTIRVILSLLLCSCPNYRKVGLWSRATVLAYSYQSVAWVAKNIVIIYKVSGSIVIRINNYRWVGITPVVTSGHGCYFAISSSAKDTPVILITTTCTETNILQPIVSITPRHYDYNHAGGLQACDTYLAVGLERLEAGEHGNSTLVFYALDNPKKPVELVQLL